MTVMHPFNFLVSRIFDSGLCKLSDDFSEVESSTVVAAINSADSIARMDVLEQVRETIYDEMDALTLEFHTTTGTITPEYILLELERKCGGPRGRKDPMPSEYHQCRITDSKLTQEEQEKKYYCSESLRDSFTAYTTNLSFPGKVRTCNTNEISIRPQSGFPGVFGFRDCRVLAECQETSHGGTGVVLVKAQVILLRIHPIPFGKLRKRAGFVQV
jgi:hypothetical protein